VAMAERIPTASWIRLHFVDRNLPMRRILVEVMTAYIRPELLEHRSGAASQQNRQTASNRAVKSALIFGQIQI